MDSKPISELNSRLDIADGYLFGYFDGKYKKYSRGGSWRSVRMEEAYYVGYEDAINNIPPQHTEIEAERLRSATRGIGILLNGDVVRAKLRTLHSTISEASRQCGMSYHSLYNTIVERPYKQFIKRTRLEALASFLNCEPEELILK